MITASKAAGTQIVIHNKQHGKQQHKNRKKNNYPSKMFENWAAWWAWRGCCCGPESNRNIKNSRYY